MAEQDNTLILKDGEWITPCCKARDFYVDNLERNKTTCASKDGKIIEVAPGEREFVEVEKVLCSACEAEVEIPAEAWGSYKTEAA